MDGQADEHLLPYLFLRLCDLLITISMLPSMQSSSKANILLVDDSVENLRVLSTMLTKQGYEVRCARSGAIALTSLQTIDTDLILLDIRMPALDGYQVCQTLKSDPHTSEIPVIFISALDEAMDKVRAFEVGGADYITKPFEIPEVLARIEHQLMISQLQAQLHQQNQELARSNRELEKFASTVSHDLRNPLQSFVYYTEALEDDFPKPLDESAQRYFAKLKTAYQSMQTLIDNLLAYAQATQSERVLSPVEGEQILTAALELLAPQIEAAGAHISHEQLPLLLGDRTQLLQLLQNLLSNALKFQRPGISPQINITVKHPSPAASTQATVGDTTSSMVEVGIHDNGIGVAAQLQEQIFEAFSRLPEAQSYPGHGIGLATCKKIVEGHGGQIWVKSTPGAGASFYVTLPLPCSP